MAIFKPIIVEDSDGNEMLRIEGHPIERDLFILTFYGNVCEVSRLYVTEIRDALDEILRRG